MHSVALSAGVAFAAASLVALVVSLHYAELLADWRLPGLAALLAIASNVAFMSADRLAAKRSTGSRARRRRRLQG